MTRRSTPLEAARLVQNPLRGVARRPRARLPLRPADVTKFLLAQTLEGVRRKLLGAAQGAALHLGTLIPFDYCRKFGWHIPVPFPGPWRCSDGIAPE